MHQNRLMHTHKKLGLLVDVLNEIFSILTKGIFLATIQ